MNDQDDAPRRVQPRLTSRPKIREVFLCDFPRDVQLPEVGKTRPVLIISKRTRLYGKVIVLPITTKSQPRNPKAYPIPVPFPARGISRDTIAWVICDHLTTVAVSRLRAPRRKIPRLDQEQFDWIVGIALEGLPTPSAEQD